MLTAKTRKVKQRAAVCKQRQFSENFKESPNFPALKKKALPAGEGWVGQGTNTNTNTSQGLHPSLRLCLRSILSNLPKQLVESNAHVIQPADARQAVALGVVVVEQV